MSQAAFRPFCPSADDGEVTALQLLDPGRIELGYDEALFARHQFNADTSTACMSTPADATISLHAFAFNLGSARTAGAVQGHRQLSRKRS